MGPRHRGRGNAFAAAAECEKLTASMGPRHRGRGNPSTPASCPRPVSSFNGATAQRPWKFGWWHWSGYGDYWLQWGHGTEAVEIWRREPEPQFLIWLQWGHGTEAVEMRDVL